MPSYHEIFSHRWITHSMFSNCMSQMKCHVPGCLSLAIGALDMKIIPLWTNPYAQQLAADITCIFLEFIHYPLSKHMWTQEFHTKLIMEYFFFSSEFHQTGCWQEIISLIPTHYSHDIINILTIEHSSPSSSHQSMMALSSPSQHKENHPFLCSIAPQGSSSLLV